jgi:hypothetical protein
LIRIAYAALLLLLVLPALAQTEPEPWAYWVGVDAFIAPDESYGAPTVMADRGWMHLEARYNYEGQQTASAWFGYNINHANRDVWVVTPMISAVVGDTNGIAPGVEAIANWKKFDVYVEGEYLIATDDDGENFTYFWSEFAYSPVSWLRTGIAAQRTRAYETSVDIQRGLLVGFKVNTLTFTTSVFEPGTEDQTVVATAAMEF